MLISEVTFEEWLSFVFDAPVTHGDWLGEFQRGYWNDAPEILLAYLTRAFAEAGKFLTPYSDAQLNQALWEVCNEYCNGFFDGNLPLTDRIRGIESIYSLYEQLFAPRCTAITSNGLTKTTGVSHLNSICYMWWDVFPTWGNRDEQGNPLGLACLEVMEKSLSLDSIACQEGALHGLGHWHLHYPTETEASIDDYLKQHYTKGGKKKIAMTRTTSLPLDLERYALSARSGCIQ
jgi:hypothetical protein